MEDEMEMQSPTQLKTENRHEISFWQHRHSKPLNFATNPDDNDSQAVKKPKTPRDPMSHRIIEKRRRDRMNNCLADLSRLIPANLMKQGQGRIEKTEIIEMAIKHIRQLRAKVEAKENGVTQGQAISTSNLLQKPCCSEKFYMGFKECQAELMRFLVETEGWNAKNRICNRLMKQLDEASQKYTGNFGGSTEFDEDGKKEEESSPQPIMCTPSEMSDTCRYNASPVSSSLCDGDLVDLGSFKANNCGPFSSNQDQHLRTLLTKSSQSSVTENESGIATLSVEEPDQLLTDGSSSKKSPESDIQCCEMEHPEDLHSLSSISRRTDDSSTYKFKQNITLRFSEEKRKASDTSSISSREEDNKIKIRRKVSKSKSMSPRSDSSTYPTSDHSSNGNISSMTSENQTPERPDHKHIKKEYRKKNTLLPGFLLHPMGSFYFPISLSESLVANLGYLPFQDTPTPHHPTLLHPISIPVNFGSHLMTMRNININSNLSDSHNNFSDGKIIECSKPSRSRSPSFKTH